MPLTDEEQKFGEVRFIRVSDGTAGLSKSAPPPGPSPRSRPSAGRLCPRLPNARRRERSPAAAAPPPDPVSGSARPVRESALTVGRAHPPRLPLSRVLRAWRVTLTRLWCLPKTTPGVCVSGCLRLVWGRSPEPRGTFLGFNWSPRLCVMPPAGRAGRERPGPQAVSFGPVCHRGTPAEPQPQSWVRVRS